MSTDPSGARLREVLDASMRDLQRGDAAAALQRLLSLPAPLAGEPMVQLQVALAHKQTGDAAAEMAALVRALDADPYFYPALLQKATLLERTGRRRAAARVYADALKIMPASDRRNPAMQRAVAAAERAVSANREELAAHLEHALADLRRRHPGERLERFDESLEVLVGRKRAYFPEPVMFLFTQLPSIQFYDRALFPWLEELESATDAIRDEIVPVIATDRQDFPPYINFPAGAPVNQWQELNRSQRWSTFFLWKDGEKVAQNCARCPTTAALLDRLPLARVPNFSPNVMFSCLDPHTRIPPHTGDTNTRLVVHLPLIVPGSCTFRVGNDTRPWEYGRAWVFDDSIEHEARNDSDHLRVVLIFDVWNPFLTEAERRLVATTVNELSQYYGATS